LKEFNKYKFLVLSDLHLPIDEKSSDFSYFLHKLEQFSKVTEKIIFLGDVFTIWSGIFPFNHENGQKLIEKVEQLSEICEFYFVEGNYDFYICNNWGKVFNQCSEKYLKLNVNGIEFFFTHGHLHTSFKDRVFMSILKSNCFRLLLEYKLIRPMVLKMQKQFEKGSLSKKFENKDLTKFTENLMRRFRGKNIICGHFHTYFKNQNVTIIPDYLTKKQCLVFDGKELKLINSYEIDE